MALLGLILVLAYYLFVWRMAGRDPRPGVIVTRYTPPEGMTPAVVRYITRMGYDDKTLAAAVIDMAVKGRLTIRESEGTFTLRKEEKGNQPLSAEEEQVMRNLFGSSQEITLETARHTTIRSAIKSFRDYLAMKYEKIYFVTNRKYFFAGIGLTMVLLVLSGLWEAGSKGRLPIFFFICIWLSGWTIGVLALVNQVVVKWRHAIRHRGFSILEAGGALFLTLFSLPFVAGEIFGISVFGYATSITTIIFLLSAGLANHLFYHLLKAPTRAGRSLLDAVEGFRTFLAATEEDRLNMLNPPERTPALFERYLPYALALDLEQRWAEQFSDVLSAAGVGGAGAYSPGWFSGTSLSGMTSGDFASSLGDSFSGAISSSSTAPGSSSGSGGGGSSGGGGGGGGGGGW